MSTEPIFYLDISYIVAYPGGDRSSHSCSRTASLLFGALGPESRLTLSPYCGVSQSSRWNSPMSAHILLGPESSLSPYFGGSQSSPWNSPISAHILGVPTPRSLPVTEGASLLSRLCDSPISAHILGGPLVPARAPALSAFSLEMSYIVILRISWWGPESALSPITGASLLRSCLLPSTNNIGRKHARGLWSINNLGGCQVETRMDSSRFALPASKKRHTLCPKNAKSWSSFGPCDRVPLDIPGTDRAHDGCSEDVNYCAQSKPTVSQSYNSIYPMIPHF